MKIPQIVDTLINNETFCARSLDRWIDEVLREGGVSSGNQKISTPKPTPTPTTSPKKPKEKIPGDLDGDDPFREYLRILFTGRK